MRLIVAATVLGCVGYGAYLMSGTASGPVVLTVVALVVAAAAVAQLLLPASGKGGHLTAVAFAGAAVLLLPAAASVSCVIRGLGPFDTPFESSKTAHNNQALAAAAPALTRAVQRLELQTPPGDALFGTDTSGLAENYILYSGREVLPIGGFLGNVPAPTLATLQADISRGYVRGFVLPVSPPGPDPRVRWIESHCARQPPPPHRRPVPYANFFCGLGPVAGRPTQRPEHLYHRQVVPADRGRQRPPAVPDARAAAVADQAEPAQSTTISVSLLPMRTYFSAGGAVPGNSAMDAVKVCRKFWPPTGPSSPAQKNPATGMLPSSSASSPASWRARGTAAIRGRCR